MKIIMAPVNIAGQPICLVKELKRQNLDIQLVQYSSDKKELQGHKFGYDCENLVMVAPGERIKVQLSTLEKYLDAGVDIFHFWLRSLFFRSVYTDFTGFDIPIINSFGKKIVYRFTGEDIRLKSKHMQINPYNAHRYGYETKLNEDIQRKYIDYISQYVDQFLVGDPELQEFIPDAKIIPRVINLNDFPFVGAKRTNCPLVIHAPSDKKIKGTSFVHQAVEHLKSEGLNFRYEEVVDLANDEAIALYKSADIVIDQLHIGWYGVLAIEAMALGKTVITYIREDLFETYQPRIPIVNANPDNIIDKLRMTIKDYDLRYEISQQARSYVEKVHDVKIVAGQLKQVYQDVLVAPPLVKKASPIIDYMYTHFDVAYQNFANMTRHIKVSERLKKEVAHFRRQNNLLSQIETSYEKGDLIILQIKENDQSKFIQVYNWKSLHLILSSYLKLRRKLAKIKFIRKIYYFYLNHLNQPTNNVTPNIESKGNE